MTMSTPEPVLRHKRKPGYDRGPDTEIHRPYPHMIKYFGDSEADDRTETLPAVASCGEEPTEVLPLVPVTSTDDYNLSPAVKRLAYATAVTFVTCLIFSASGVLAFVGWLLWEKVL